MAVYVRAVFFGRGADCIVYSNQARMSCVVSYFFSGSLFSSLLLLSLSSSVSQ